ncbi:MAG: lactonase family protein [Streptococcaceae bacterium]|jgi:6-phosphogluconolactonase|nr:lactonase family protein [Streptococcaceae bacterium]
MTEKIYFGTYTKRISEGIYSLDLNLETKQLGNLQLVAKEANPTYLSFDEENHLYTVGATDTRGGIAAFDANFKLLNHVVEEGAPLCYVAVDEKRNLVYGANYHKGEILVYRKLSDGRIELSDKVPRSGHGPHENQTSSHVHFADLTPDNYLVACDLGTDSVTTYDIKEGKLVEIANFQATAGSGARHIVFHPRNKIAYLFCELDSTIEVLVYDGRGDFELLQKISTIPETHTTFNGGAAIRISNDGEFVYASNRGHNSIAVFSTDLIGLLTLVDYTSTEGEIPRDFNFNVTEDFLIVANQDSDNVTLFERDSKTGELILRQKDVFLPEGLCVLPH